MADITTTEARTFQAVLSTGAQVRRDGMRPDQTWGPWTEAFNPAGADLSRMVGAPLLLDHLARTDFQIGVVEAAKVEHGAIAATVRFGTDPRARQIAADVRDRIRRQLSVGFNVTEWCRNGAKTDPVPLFTAAKWQILEASVVAIGADAGAVFRSADPPELRTRTMTVTAEAAPEAALPIITNSPDPLLEARTAETARVDGILMSAEKLHLPLATARAMIQAGTDLATARQQLIDAAAQRAQETRVSTVVSGADYSSPSSVSEALAEAFANRCNPDVKLTDRARQYRGMRTAEALRHLLVASNVRPGTSEREIVTRAATTSDFPGLLAATVNKALLPTYDAARSGLVEVARKDSVRDFKSATRLRAGEFPALLQVSEHAEYLSGSIPESKETFVLKKYGRIFSISWEALVNDDLAALGDAARSSALASANLEADLLATMVTSNPNMADGTPVYHANHANLSTSAAAITTASVSESIAFMRKQKGLDAATILNIKPRYLAVPAAIETAARQLVSATVVPGSTATVNAPFVDLTVVVDPRLDGNSITRWYLFGDAGASPSLSIAFLEGEEGPVVETRNSFTIDAVEVKVRHVAAAYWADFRSTTANPGA